jgi:hypothetical protein
MIVSKLTGHWVIKKRWFGFKIMVEAQGHGTCPYTGDPDPEGFFWKEATPRDLIELSIHII